jgi:hypothetical protein
MPIMFAYKLMRFAVSDSKNHWHMTFLDDPDLAANSEPEISAAGFQKKAAAMVVSCYAKKPIDKVTGQGMVYSYLQHSASVRSRAEVITPAC